MNAPMFKPECGSRLTKSTGRNFPSNVFSNDPPPLRNVHQSIADCIGHDLSGPTNTDLSHDIGAVRSHRVFAQSELGGNFFARLAVNDQLQYLELPRG